MQRTRSFRPSLFTYVPLAAALIAAPRLAAQETFELSGDAAAVWNLAGTVSISGGGSTVTVDVRRGGRDAARLEMRTGSVDLDRQDVGRAASLRVVYPGDEIVYSGAGTADLKVRDDGTFYIGGGGRNVTIRDSGRGLDAHANLDIQVPRGRTLLVFLAVGQVEVSNVDGNLTVDTGSAEIRASGTRGRLVLDTGSGDIELDGATGDIVLDTGSGDVSVRDVGEGDLVVDTGSGDVSGRAFAVASLNVDTGSGDVSLEDVRATEVTVDTGSGDVDAGFASNIEDLRVDTGSGDVALTLPAAWTGAVELETASGDIHSDFEVSAEEMDEDHLHGRVGEGGGRLEVDTGSGDIRLVRG